MNKKYFVYALFVTIVATFGSWFSMVGESTRPGGSSWSSGYRGGSGGYGGGYSGGSGHK
jgi:hypothetical protein